MNKRSQKYICAAMKNWGTWKPSSITTVLPLNHVSITYRWKWVRNMANLHANIKSFGSRIHHKRYFFFLEKFWLLFCVCVCLYVWVNKNKHGLLFNFFFKPRRKSTCSFFHTQWKAFFFVTVEIKHFTLRLSKRELLVFFLKC